MFDVKELREAVLKSEAKNGGDSAKHWRMVPVVYLVEYFEERAAISEHDGGLSRESAEHSAVAQTEGRFRIYELIPE